MSNLNFNKVFIGGRLTADPELKTTQSGLYVTQFTVAVNRRASQENAQKADFINVIAWRERAEFVAKYFRKGSSIFIVGQIQTRSWTDNQNQKRYATEVIADEIQFVDSKSESPQTAQNPPQTVENDRQGSYIPDAYKQSKAPAFEEISGSDDDLPF